MSDTSKPNNYHANRDGYEYTKNERARLKVLHTSMVDSLTRVIKEAWENSKKVG